MIVDRRHGSGSNQQRLDCKNAAMSVLDVLIEYWSIDGADPAAGSAAWPATGDLPRRSDAQMR
jgi:hypothetical protein